MLPRLGCASEFPDIRSTNVQSLNQTKREVATSWLPMNLLNTSPTKLLASRAAGSPCSWLRLGPGAGSVQRREDNRPVGQGRSPNTGLALVARVASFHFHLEGKIKAYVGHVTQDMKRKLGGITISWLALVRPDLPTTLPPCSWIEPHSRKQVSFRDQPSDGTCCYCSTATAFGTGPYEIECET